MKKLAMLVIAAAIMPLVGKAMYVDCNLTDYNLWDFPVEYGYYLLVIDNSYEFKDFKDTIVSGTDTSADLGDIPREKILYYGSTTTAENHIDVGQPDVNSAYLAVFTTDDFPGEAYYTLYSAKDTRDTVSGDLLESIEFPYDGEIWLGNTYHVKTLSNSIPEPSSGLLTLAGLSVLALKRKRRACVFS